MTAATPSAPVHRERTYPEVAHPESGRQERTTELPTWAADILYEAQRRLVTSAAAAMAGHLQELFGQRITAVRPYSDVRSGRTGTHTTVMNQLASGNLPRC